MFAQLGLISFALLALTAIVVDAGLLRLTQAQMQTAADAAALEGLRARDVRVLDQATSQPVLDSFASDCLRRSAARRVVRSMFDDDLDPSTEGADDVFGAGPIIDLTEGATSLHAYSDMSVPAARVYKPAPQLNQGNAVDGDMVSGRFCYTDDPARSEDAAHALPGTVVCAELQRADGSYARNDFNPSAAAPQPPPQLPGCPDADEAAPASWPRSNAAPLTAGDHDAFLVRLRRSNEFTGFDGQTEPDVASSGPPLPLLYGRGSLIQGDDPASPYSVRRDGFTVRATAIAGARAAMRVGLPVPASGRPGVTPFALVDTFAGTLTTTAIAATVNPATGLMCSGTTCAATTPSIGRFIDGLTDPTRSRWRLISTVGQALPAAVPLACALVAPGIGYGPVYSLMPVGGNRIIGFVPIAITRDPARPADACALRLQRGAEAIASANASAVMSGSFTLPAGAQPSDLRELLDRHFARQGRVAYGPLLAPVLVR